MKPWVCVIRWTLIITIKSGEAVQLVGHKGVYISKVLTLCSKQSTVWWDCFAGEIFFIRSPTFFTAFKVIIYVGFFSVVKYCAHFH